MTGQRLSCSDARRKLPALTDPVIETPATEAIAWLRLQLEWGVDEAVGEAPVDRLARPAPPSARQPQTARPAPPPARPPSTARPVASPASPPARAREAQDAAAAASDLDALRRAIRDFDGCPLCHTAGHTLLPEGPADASLLLVGEVPGADEDRAGRLFAGQAGDLLDRMLGSIGLDRTRLLAAPLIPWRPPGDRKVGAAEMALCLPFLQRLIGLCRPQRVLLLGVRPARALFGEDPSARQRGRWREFAVPDLDRTLPALATRHPSFLLANPLARREAWSDLLLLRRTLDDDAEHSRGV